VPACLVAFLRYQIRPEDGLLLYAYCQGGMRGCSPYQLQTTHFVNPTLNSKEVEQIKAFVDQGISIVGAAAALNRK
jgi:hypothetical protein